MFLKREIRIGAAVALVAVLTLTLAAPARAVNWGETWDWSSGLIPRVLSWLGIGPDSAASPKCDDGPSIDPDGCSSTTAPMESTKAEDGASIDPNGNH